jgi:membrane peptidoglycan carboxypeptidase
MTSPPNRPRGSARVPGPEPDGPGSRAPGYGGHGAETGRNRTGQYTSSAGGSHSSAPRHSAGGYEPVAAAEPDRPVSGRHSRNGGSTSPASYGAAAPGNGRAASRHGANGGHRHGGDEDDLSEFTRSLRHSADDEPPSGRHSRAAASDAPMGTASVGAAPAGKAAVGGAPVGTASVGAAPVGSASVGAAPVGSASVGSANVGRATVRSAVPEAPPAGPRSRAEERLAAKNTAKARKKRRRRRRIIAGCAALLLIAGIGTIAAGYYFTSVPLPNALNPQVPTTFYYSNGKPMARLGSVNGSDVDVSKLPAQVKYAVVSAEDRTFYTNSGVDFKGILRATWGHLMGNEDAGGASTITMQYAKLLADRLQENRTYTEKLKESVIALKLDQKYSKDQILGFYLDLAYFNRGAYGLDAAAQAYFGKDAADLTAEQAAVLAADIKDPAYYDPSNNLKAAQARWEYVLQGMKAAGYYHKPISLANYPKNIQKPDANNDGASWGLDKPTGLIIPQIEKELVDNKVPGFSSVKEADNKLRTGGYKIYTTINQKAEADAVRVANKDIKGLQKGIANALVAVDPSNGGVVAYYGGNDGTGFDTASSTHQPGSSFKIYNLAAALENGYSINSVWNGDPSEKVPARTDPVSNSDGESCDDAGHYQGHDLCTLKEATIMSLNTVFYELAYKLGKDKVIQAAQAAGIRTLVPTADSSGNVAPPIDLTKKSAEDAANTPGVGYEVGFGQNPVTPLDHANGVATIADNGTYHPEHFITKMVNDSGKTVYTPNRQGTQAFGPNSADITADIGYVLQRVPADPSEYPWQYIRPDRPFGIKTGTWQYGNNANENSQAWTVGYVPQLAAVVWYGEKDHDAPIYTNMFGGGKMMYGSEEPGKTWADFMSAALKDMKTPVKQFPQAKFIGNRDLGQYTHEEITSPSPTPSPSPSPSMPYSPSPSPSYGGPPWRSPSPSTSSSPCTGWVCNNTTGTAGQDTG